MKKNLLTPAIKRGLKMLLKLLKAEDGVIELCNRNSLRLIMEQNKIFMVKIADEQIVPVWQFDDQVYPHMPKLLKIFRQKKVSGLMIMAFFVNRNLRLNNKNPLQALRDGQVKEVLRAARTYLEHGAA